MQEFDVNIRFDGFWSMYDAKLCGGGPQKGSKSVALKSAQKRVKTEEQGKMIFAALAAQKQYYFDCQKNNVFHAKFPHAVTWLNQERWAIEINSHAEMKEKVARSKCRCGQEVQVNYPSGGKCIDCHNNFYKDHDWRYQSCRESFVKMGLKKHESETKQEHIARVRELGANLLKSVKNRG